MLDCKYLYGMHGTAVRLEEINNLHTMYIVCICSIFIVFKIFYVFLNNTFHISIKEHAVHLKKGGKHKALSNNRVNPHRSKIHSY